MTVVCFDVDGTLIDDKDYPRNSVRDALMALHALGVKIVVWSGGGADYARTWGRRLWLPDDVEYYAKGPLPCVPDLYFDDEPLFGGAFLKDGIQVLV